MPFISLEWRNVRAFEVSGKTQLSVMEADGLDISKYGVAIPGGDSGSVAGLFEKIDADKAPSNLVSIVGYICPLISSIFCVISLLELAARSNWLTLLILRQKMMLLRLLNLMGVALTVIV